MSFVNGEPLNAEKLSKEMKNNNLKHILLLFGLILAIALFIVGLVMFAQNVGIKRSVSAASQPTSVEDRLANLEKKLTEVTKENERLKKNVKPTEPTVIGGKLIFYPNALYGIFYPAGYERLDNSDDEICVIAGQFQQWFGEVNQFVKELNTRGK